MFSKTSIIILYIKHSIIILFRYQQIYAYMFLIIVLILMPLLFEIKEQYYSFLVSFNYLIVLWLFSPFFLKMFSFSSEDSRSLTLFPVQFIYLIAARNILNIGLMIIAFGLTIVLMIFFYPKTNWGVPDLIVLSLMHLFPAISIGNLTSRSSLSWTGKTTFSWKSLYVILILNFNLLLFQVSKFYFSHIIFLLILAIIFLSYIGLYYLSFQKIVKDIPTYFSSIAEK